MSQFNAQPKELGLFSSGFLPSDPIEVCSLFLSACHCLGMELRSKDRIRGNFFFSSAQVICRALSDSNSTMIDFFFFFFFFHPTSLVKALSSHE